MLASIDHVHVSNPSGEYRFIGYATTFKSIMSEKSRNKRGCFVKKKVADRQVKAALHRKLQAAEARYAKNGVSDSKSECRISGRRIIDVGILHKQMRCTHCQRDLSFRNIEAEESYGLASIWSIRCSSCQKII